MMKYGGGGGVSCQFFIWFVALLIALTAGSGGCAGLIILILGPDLICMLGCVAIFIFFACICSLDLSFAKCPMPLS